MNLNRFNGFVSSFLDSQAKLSGDWDAVEKKRNAINREVADYLKSPLISESFTSDSSGIRSQDFYRTFSRLTRRGYYSCCWTAILNGARVIFNALPDSVYQRASDGVIAAAVLYSSELNGTPRIPLGMLSAVYGIDVRVIEQYYATISGIISEMMVDDPSLRNRITGRVY